MALKVSIGGTLRSFYVDSLELDMKLGKPATGSFELREALGASLVTRGQEVIVYDDELTETIRGSIPAAHPPGLRYEAGYEGHLKCDLPPTNHDSGCGEAIFANLYNLPDLSEYETTLDIMLEQYQVYRADWWSYFPFLRIGVQFKYPEARYYYTAVVSTMASDIQVVSTTHIELDVSKRLSISWSTTGGVVTVKLYVDGILEDTQTETTTMYSNPGSEPDQIEVAGLHEAAVAGIGAYFADIRYWTDARTDAEIHDNAFRRLTGADLLDTNLGFYWKCDEMTGITCNDSGPLDHDGTITDDGFGVFGWMSAPDQWLAGSASPCGDSTVAYRHFGGKISDVEYEISESDDAAGGMMVQKVQLTDYSEAANRRLVNQNFLSAHNGKYYVQWVAEHMLALEGINYQCIPAGSPIFSVPNWSNTYAKKALDQITSSTGWIWYIDPYKEVRYHPRGYKAAPWNISDSDSPAKYFLDSMKPTLNTSDYYNKLRARIKITPAGETAPIVVAITIQNDAEIAAMAALTGGSGIYEHYEDITEASTVEQGIDMAAGKLAAACVLGKTVTYQTETAGLRVGMLQTIERADYGLSGPFLIESINITLRERTLIYKVTVSSWLMIKDDPLSRILDSALESKKNWQESLSEGIGYATERASTAGIDVILMIEEGIDPGSSGWDNGVWDSEEWGA